MLVCVPASVTETFDDALYVVDRVNESEDVADTQIVALPVKNADDVCDLGEDADGATLDDEASDALLFALRDEDTLALRLSEGEPLNEVVDV